MRMGVLNYLGTIRGINISIRKNTCTLASHLISHVFRVPCSVQVRGIHILVNHKLAPVELLNKQTKNRCLYIYISVYDLPRRPTSALHIDISRSLKYLACRQAGICISSIDLARAAKQPASIYIGKQQ